MKSNKNIKKRFLKTAAFSVIFIACFISSGFVSGVKLLCGEDFEVTQHVYFLEFKDKTNFTVLNALGVDANWAVYDAKDFKKAIKEGVGNTTPEIEFTKPGVFKCVFSVTANNTFHSDTCTINVSDSKLIFRPELAKLNKPVKYSKTDSLKGYILSIPIEYYSYSKSEANFIPKVNASSGVIGVFVKPLTDVKLKNGKQTISFELYGKPNSDGKAQIGFFNTAGKGFFYNFLVVK